jgi:hypothetical protein
VSTVEGARRRTYFAWLQRHPSEAAALRDVPPEVLSRLWLDAWQAGSWDAIKRNTDLGLSLAQIVQRLEELAELFRVEDIEREAENGSTYWRTDEQGSEYWSDEAVDEAIPQ